MTLPLGVTTGVCAISSGVSPPPARRMIGTRCSPSKYSPSHEPSPSERMMSPTVARSQPASAMRRSSGTACSSSCAASVGGNACTFAPGNFSSSSWRPASATLYNFVPSSPCRWIDTERAEPPKPPNRLPSSVNTRVSGKPTTISSRTSLFQIADALFVDHARADRAAARPQQDVPVLQLRLLVVIHVRLHAREHLRHDLACRRRPAPCRAGS